MPLLRNICFSRSGQQNGPQEDLFETNQHWLFTRFQIHGALSTERMSLAFHSVQWNWSSDEGAAQSGPGASDIR